jgi:hypothetical protein
MNERWKYTLKFNCDDMVLIALELDGCFKTLEELRGFGSRSRFFKTSLPAEYVNNKRQFELNRLSKEKIETINFDAKNMADSICEALDAINELDDNDFDVPFGYYSPRDITCTKEALYCWLKRLGLTGIAEQFKPIDSPSQTKKNDSKSRLNESTYWTELGGKAQKAIDEYPTWRASQTKSNVDRALGWLEESISKNKREAQIIKNVLSDFYDLKI